MGKSRENSTPKYINLLTDFGFKRVFGNQEIMSAFLTDLLRPSSPITKLTYLDKEMPASAESGRGVIYDLRCSTADGREFLVEMQNTSQESFSDRIIYYLSRSVSSQGKKGDTQWDFNFTPVYGVFFLNFHLAGFKPMTVRTVRMGVKETGETFSDKIGAYTLELPEFHRKKMSSCHTDIDRWLYNITNLERMEDTVPFSDSRPIFEKLGVMAEYAALTPEQQRQYDKSLDNYRTNLCALETKRKEGHAEGREEGFAEGMEKGLEKGKAEGLAEGMEKGMEKGKAEGDRDRQVSVARALLSMGVLTVAQISEATGLTAAEIETLR